MDIDSSELKRIFENMDHTLRLMRAWADDDENSTITFFADQLRKEVEALKSIEGVFITMVN